MDGKLLSETFVELTDTLVAGFDVIDFLHVLTNRSVQLLDVSAAGLLLADPRGELRVVAASSEAARLLELFQLQNDQGPCLECFPAGRVRRRAGPADAVARAGHRCAELLPRRPGSLSRCGHTRRAGPGRRGHHQPAARAQHAPQRYPQRAAADGAE